MFFLWFLMLMACVNSIQAQQHYDKSDCSEDNTYPGSRYICNSNSKSCSTFLVYRANQQFNTISSVSHLFQGDTDELIRLNSLSSPSEMLQQSREVLIPVSCSCSGEFFQVKFSYMVPDRTTLSEIACSVFEGLVKSHTLLEQNPSQKNDVDVGSNLEVLLRCACPDNSSGSEVRYLVTYPVVEGDALNILSQKFGISPVDLWAANNLEPLPTIYPNTTILIPLKEKPVINFNIPNSPPPTPGFLPTVTVEKKANTKLMNLYISLSVVGFCLILTALVAVGWYANVLCKRKIQKLQSFNTRSSPCSCSPVRSSPRSGTLSLSPDLLVGIKYSLKNYSIQDLKKATKDFSEEYKIGDQAYKGMLDNVEVMIKQFRFEDTRQVIDAHSKINHINIVNLLGVCYGENDFSWSYLMFELPSNGSLRDCLSNSPSALPWHRRIQIAFDLATGLHYLHCCIFPLYAHMCISSRQVFVTSNWRAKLTNIRSNAAAAAAESTKANRDTDIFAFGVVLLELISGRREENLLKECIGFLGGGASEGGCFEQLRIFIDPCLRDDYPLAEALCIAVLAKACVEDDPLHRPSMDDILKVLVRLI